MNRSFYNGVSGIKTHQFGMDVWSHNISNINNVGYKAQIPEFENIYAQTISASIYNPVASQVGLGSTGQVTAISQTQGSLVNADNPFDMALSDEGWFGTLGQDGQIYYTRRGDFSVDEEGNLVARNGNFLLAKKGMKLSENALIDTSHDIDLGGVGDHTSIQLPKKLQSKGSPTTKIDFKANIDPSIKEEVSNATLKKDSYQTNISQDRKTLNFSGDASSAEGISPKEGDLVTIVVKNENGIEKKVTTNLDKDLKWSVKNFKAEGLDVSKELITKVSIDSRKEVASTQQISTTIINPEGQKNTLFMDFTKKIPNSKYPNSWEVVLSIKDEEQKVLSTKTGNITFDEQGGIKSTDITSIQNGSSTIKLNLGTHSDDSSNTTNIDGITSMATGHYGAGKITRDGYLQGDLLNYSLDDEGQICANFSNGQNTPVARIGVYHFQNDQGLDSVGGDYFLPTEDSGEAIFYKNGQGKHTNGTQILANKLEMSNVSLATALTEVIIMQKAFDASSKSVTTSDQMIQNAINLKR